MLAILAIPFFSVQLGHVDAGAAMGLRRLSDEARTHAE